MKNIYKITKGQLISLWVFGVIGWIFTLDSYSDSSGFLSILIPAILVFYTIGWRSQNKKPEIETEGKDFKAKILAIDFKKLVKPFVALLLIIIIGFGIIKLAEAKKEKDRIEKLKQDYSQGILKVDSLKEQVLSCIKPVYDKNYQEEVRSCNLLKNKIKADYDMCLTYTYVSARASCLYDYDYEKIDCSEEVLKAKALSKVTQSDVPKLCNDLLSELQDTNLIIEEYSKLKE